jgi:hypothetical protein
VQVTSVNDLAEMVHVDWANSIDTISAYSGKAVPVRVTAFVAASQVKSVISPTGGI